MRAAVLSLGSQSSKMIAEAMNKYFDVVDHLSLKDVEVAFISDGFQVMCDGKLLGEYDCIYARGSFRYASVLSSLTAALREKTYLPLHHNSFIIANDKFLTQLHFLRKKIPMPAAYIAATSSAAKKALENLNYPVMIKLPQGTHGKGVLYAESYASASSMCDALVVLKQPFIIQEFVETAGTDIRAIVAAGKVVVSYTRTAKKGEIRSGFHSGGVCTLCILDNETQKMAVKAAKALGCDVVAIDILKGPKSPLILEANLSPGITGISKASNINVADKIAKALYDKAKEFKLIKTKNGFGEVLRSIDKPKPSYEIITNLDFRGERVLLPENFVKMADLKDDKEYIIKAKKGYIIIKDSMLM
ncbi:MAG: RimK family alpha-L-glutamate ligase [Nanoarchaeota archaeon]|nr:RimK family alpha-L-glutamate ligase [Nanoarchaeota archaeon]